MVKKKVKEGTCGGARLCWLEWDCPEENRFVTGIEIVPRGGGQPRCGPLGEAL